MDDNKVPISQMEIKPFEFTRSNPDCGHCGTVYLAMHKWPQAVHDLCDCPCHRWRSQAGKLEMAEMKKAARRRKKN